MLPKKNIISKIFIISILVSNLYAKNFPSPTTTDNKIQDYLLHCFDQGAYRSGLIVLEDRKTEVSKLVYHWWRGFLFLAAENYYRSELEYARLDTLLTSWDAQSPLRFLSLAGQAEALSMQGDKTGANLFAEDALKLLPSLSEVKPHAKYPRFQIAMALYSLGHHFRNQLNLLQIYPLSLLGKIDSMTQAARISLVPLFPAYPGLNAWLHIQDGNFQTDIIGSRVETTVDSMKWSTLNRATIHYQRARSLLMAGFHHKHFLLSRTYGNEFLAHSYAKFGFQQYGLLAQAHNAALDTIQWKGEKIPFNISPADLSFAAVFKGSEVFQNDLQSDPTAQLNTMEQMLLIAETGHCERWFDPVLQHPNYLLEQYGLHSWFQLAAVQLLQFQSFGDSTHFKNAWNILTTYQAQAAASSSFAQETSPNNFLEVRGRLLNKKRNLLENLWLLDPPSPDQGIGIFPMDSASILDSLLDLQAQIEAIEASKAQKINPLTAFRAKMKSGDVYVGLFSVWANLVVQIITTDTIALTIHPFWKSGVLSYSPTDAERVQHPVSPFPNSSLSNLKEGLAAFLPPIKGKVKRLLLAYGPELQGIGLEHLISEAYFGSEETNPCLPTILSPDFNRLNNDNPNPVSILLAAPNYEGSTRANLSGAAIIAATKDSLGLSIQNADNRAQMIKGLEEGKVVIFYGHASMNAFQPQQSSLIVNDGEAQSLHAMNLADVIVKSPLVILAGCQTGAGKTTVMEGTHSLARQLLLSGAGCVVATAWEVDDQATAKIIALFLGNLNNGNLISEALANAQNSFRAKYAGSEWNNPYYWAGIQLVGGDGHIMLQKENRIAQWWFAMIFGLLMVLELLRIRIVSKLRQRSKGKQASL